MFIDAAAQDFRRVSERYPDVSAKCTDVKFPDARGRRGQRNTPVTDGWLSEWMATGTRQPLLRKLKFTPVE
jgi:hypothetical protein